MHRPQLAASVALSLALFAGSANAVEFTVTNLVSDGGAPAVTTDPDLVNAWGLALGPTTPFWVSDAGTGVSTIYDGSGAKLGLTVTIPPAPGGSPPSSPTGVVFNGTPGFQVGGETPFFIFDTEDGVIASWAPAFGTTAVVAVDNSATGAIYKGLALGGDTLFAANFNAGVVEAYDNTYAPLSTSFVDPGITSGYAPFNVQVLGGELYVAYALQDADAADEIAGAGLGYVDVFNLDGSFDRRIASPGDAVNAPWGLALAPDSFGDLAGALLVGNFGDGTISAFNPLDGDFLGKLRGVDGSPLVIDGLWALVPGNDGAGGSSSKIYFTAGPDDETHGLFGSLTAVPEPLSWAMMLLGFGMAGAALRRRRLAHALPTQRG